MLVEAAVQVSYCPIQPHNDDVHHVRVEAHRVPEPTAAARPRLHEPGPAPSHHGAEQAARPQRGRRALVGGRGRPDGQGGQRTVGGGRRPREVGTQPDLDFDGPRGRVQDSQLYTDADRKPERQDSYYSVPDRIRLKR